MEMLKSAAGLDIQAVTYRGDAPANAALIAGEIQLGVMPMATTLPLVQGGQLKALAIGGATRSPAMPDVPTVGETIPGFESTSWQGYFVPAGTPRDIVVKLQQETAKVLKLPDVMERLRAGGNEGVGSTPEEFDARLPRRHRQVRQDHRRRENSEARLMAESCERVPSRVPPEPRTATKDEDHEANTVSDHWRDAGAVRERVAHWRKAIPTGRFG